jgi:hypothetical protein
MSLARSSAMVRLAMSCALPRRLASVSSALWMAPQVGTHSTLFLTQLAMARGFLFSSLALALMAAVRALAPAGRLARASTATALAPRLVMPLL